jgi:hypothetical protein
MTSRMHAPHHTPTQDGEATYRQGAGGRILLPMLNRRSLAIGGLATVALSSLPRLAAAAGGKPILVFMGNEK